MDRRVVLEFVPSPAGDIGARKNPRDIYNLCSYLSPRHADPRIQDRERRRNRGGRVQSREPRVAAARARLVPRRRRDHVAPGQHCAAPQARGAAASARARLARLPALAPGVAPAGARGRPRRHHVGPAVPPGAAPRRHLDRPHTSRRRRRQRRRLPRPPLRPRRLGRHPPAQLHPRAVPHHGPVRLLALLDAC